MKKILIILLSSILLVGCNNTTSDEIKLEKFSRTSLLGGFNTTFQFIGYTKDQTEFDEYYNYAYDRFLYFDSIFDQFKPNDLNNGVYRINELAGQNIPTKVDDELIELLLISKEMYDETNKQVDITMGKVINFWHDSRENINPDTGVSTVPSIEQLEDSFVEDGFDYLDINTKTNEVMITNENISLDLGAVAKGYAAEQIALELEQKGLTSGLLVLGGNTRAIGLKPENINYVAGLRSPDSVFNSFTISLDSSISLVSSGDYNQFFKDEQGNKYHHVIDPDTFFPSTNARSVSILTTHGKYADAISTALLNMTFDEGMQFYEAMKDKYPIEILWTYDIEDKFDHPNGQIIDGYYLVYTDGFNKSLLTSK